MSVSQATGWTALFAPHKQYPAGILHAPIVAWCQSDSSYVYGLVVGANGRLTSAESVKGFYQYAQNSELEKTGYPETLALGMQNMLPDDLLASLHARNIASLDSLASA
jgi:hypothetical protein